MEILNSKKNKFLVYALITNILSIAVHIYLTIQHYDLKLGIAGEKSICNLSSTFNCDAVAVSSYASLAGIPLSLLAIATHAVLAFFIVSVLFDMTAHSKRVLRYALWLSLFTGSVSLVMTSISSLIIGTYCLFCIAAYIFSFLNLFFIWKSQEDKIGCEWTQDVRALFFEHRWVSILLLLIPLFGFLGNRIYLDQVGGSAKIEEFIHDSIIEWKAAPNLEFSLENSLNYQKGPGTAIMTIVEFADFLCSHCRAAYPSLHSFIESRPDVKLIFKSFPLDGTCNKAIDRKGDGSRCQLAYITYCAEKLSKKGWEVHHWIFDHQDQFFQGFVADNLIEKLNKNFQLNFQDMKTCMDQDSTIEAIANQANEGFNAKIQGTPTVFVNGKKLDRGHFLPLLEKVYAELRASN